MSEQVPSLPISTSSKCEEHLPFPLPSLKKKKCQRSNDQFYKLVQLVRLNAKKKTLLLLLPKEPLTPNHLTAVCQSSGEYKWVCASPFLKTQPASAGSVESYFFYPHFQRELQTGDPKALSHMQFLTGLNLPELLSSP